MENKQLQLPARRCDQQAVEWLADTAESGKTNFERVLFEVNTYHGQHPLANIRVDRLYTMSEKSHGLWVTVQRLLICYQWNLADCINPHRSAADSDWDNIMAYAKRLMPNLEWDYTDWRIAKRYRIEFNKCINWDDAGKFAADWRNQRGDLLTRRGMIMGARHYELHAEVEGLTMELLFPEINDDDALMKAAKMVFDAWKERQDDIL